MPTNPDPTPPPSGIAAPANLLDEMANEIDELKRKLEKLSKQMPPKDDADKKE